MINTYDNTAVESYIHEQLKIQAEETRKVQLANDRQDVFNKAIKFGAIAIALGLLIYIALSGVGNALSFEQIKRSISSVEDSENTEVIANASELSEDRILDVEAIINEGREEPKFPGENLPEAKGDVVTNYVIFEEQDIEIGNINELIVGRQYPESGAQVFDEAWCYVNLDTPGETSESLYLVNVSNNDRQVADISGDALYKLGVTQEQAIQLRGLCGI